MAKKKQKYKFNRSLFVSSQFLWSWIAHKCAFNPRRMLPYDEESRNGKFRYDVYLDDSCPFLVLADRLVKPVSSFIYPVLVVFEVSPSELEVISISCNSDFCFGPHVSNLIKEGFESEFRQLVADALTVTNDDIYNDILYVLPQLIQKYGESARVPMLLPFVEWKSSRSKELIMTICSSLPFYNRISNFGFVITVSFDKFFSDNPRPPYIKDVDFKIMFPIVNVKGTKSSVHYEDEESINDTLYSTFIAMVDSVSFVMDSLGIVDKNEKLYFDRWSDKRIVNLINKKLQDVKKKFGVAVVDL